MLKFLLEKFVEPRLARLKGETPLDKETQDKFRQFLMVSCSGEQEKSSPPRKTNADNPRKG